MRPAALCDTDHDVDYAEGGASSESNASAKNRRGHNHKTTKRWSSRREPEVHGSITWTTGTGRSYVTTPFDHRDPTPTRDENWRALRSFLASRQMEHADLDDDPHPDDDWDGDDHDGGRGHDGRGHDGGGGGGSGRDGSGMGGSGGGAGRGIGGAVDPGPGEPADSVTSEPLPLLVRGRRRLGPQTRAEAEAEAGADVDAAPPTEAAMSTDAAPLVDGVPLVDAVPPADAALPANAASSADAANPADSPADAGSPGTSIASRVRRAAAAGDPTP